VANNPISPAQSDLPDELPYVSIVLPVFQEELLIRELTDSIFETLAEAGFEFEVVIVDDGSRDGTPIILKELKHTYKQRLVVAHHIENKGNGAALRTGINVAKGRIVVTMDADGQHKAEDIPSLLAMMPPFDLVIGARTLNYRGSWYRSFANSFYNRFSSWLTQSQIKDLTSGFRAMRRSVAVNFLPLFPCGFSAPTTTTMAFIKAGYNVAFVPIEVAQRQAGHSKISLWQDGVRFVLIILRMIMLFDPLRIFLPIAMSMFLLGAAAWIAGLVAADRLVFPNSSIFLFSGALFIWLLGLVSDQIANIRIHYQGDETILFD
jgi:glycosyltransferase involved in cell wall biosynthesis